MTDKKKPTPSMKTAAATQKLTRSELDALLKSAAAASSTEGASEEDPDEADDELPPPKKAK